jgi:quercetin dioxygenase-like cupin family protein
MSIRQELITVAALLAFACSSTPAKKAPVHSDRDPFAMAAGITRAETGVPFRVVPLRPMTGDVEVLYGNPEEPGSPFAMRIRELPGTMIPVHTHPVDEHITVVQGTWHFAVGDRWDRSALKELRVGDYAFAAKGSSMFGYCPDGAVVQVQGIGPFLIHWKHGASTFDDADAATFFTFRRGDRVQTPRGPGVIRNGYASGEIIQYEVAGDDGVLHMGNQHELRRLE